MQNVRYGTRPPSNSVEINRIENSVLSTVLLKLFMKKILPREFEFTEWDEINHKYGDYLFLSIVFYYPQYSGKLYIYATLSILELESNCFVLTLYDYNKPTESREESLSETIFNSYGIKKEQKNLKPCKMMTIFI